MLATLIALAAAGVSADADAGYRHYVAGNPGDVLTETRGLIVMQGGGTDVDVNYSAMGEAAGGDQSRYVRFWKGTPVEDAIHFVVNKPAPIGGTSAGMAMTCASPRRGARIPAAT